MKSNSDNPAEELGLLDTYKPGDQVERLALRLACKKMYPNDLFKQIEAEKQFLRGAVTMLYQKSNPSAPIANSRSEVSGSELKEITSRNVNSIASHYLRYCYKCLARHLFGRNLGNQDLALQLPRCRYCGSNNTGRSRRKRRFERILSHWRIYPYRCFDCNHRFFRFR